MTPEDLLLRAALLSGLGGDAAVVARRLAGLSGGADGRSCLDAGSPLQVTVDAPGPATLRVGVRTDGTLPVDRLEGLVAPATARSLAATAARIPPTTHTTFGTWVFWSPSAVSLYVDLRDLDEEEALDRAAVVLGPRWATSMRGSRPPPSLVRPWAVRIRFDERGPERPQMLWLARGGVGPAAVAEAVGGDWWPEARSVLDRTMRDPGRSGRCVVTIPLDDGAAPGLRIGSTGWALVPEDGDKRAGLGRLVAELGGPRDHAEALWSLCRSTAAGRWRVGRAIEVRVTDAGSRVRVFLTPAVDTSRGQPVHHHDTRSIA